MEITLFNNLNSIQPIRIKDRSNQYYTVFIESRKSTTIKNYQLTDDVTTKINQGSLLVIKGLPTDNLSKSRFSSGVVKVENVDGDNQVSESKKDSDEEESIEPYQEKDFDETPSEGSNSEYYACEICGSEFASKRGLEMHKSKSHKE